MCIGKQQHVNYLPPSLTDHQKRDEENIVLYVNKSKPSLAVFPADKKCSTTVQSNMNIELTVIILWHMVLADQKKGSIVTKPC